EPPAAGGARGRRPSHRVARRRRTGNVRRIRCLRGRARRADDRPAAQGRVPRAARAHGPRRRHARRERPARRAVRPDRPRRRQGRDPRHRRRRGQRPGAVPPRTCRGRAFRGVCVLRRRGARHALAARPAPRRRRAAQRRPPRRGAFPRAQRPFERDRSHPEAAGPHRRRRPPPRAERDRRPRRSSARPHGLERAAGAVALGRQPAEGVADPAVPARRRQGDPRRGADAGRRRRRAVRHLRSAAREGRRRSRRDREVKRPARARRFVRPRRGHVARQDRRGDSRARARGAPDRRGDRRLARRGGRVMRGWLPLAVMTTLIVAVGAYTDAHQSVFLSKQNLNSLLLEAMPLILVALGQAVALLVGGFDVSVAALMTMCVVTASFTMTPDQSGFALIAGAFAVVGVGLATGVFNAFLIQALRLPSIVATLGTLSVLEGASLWLRSYPQGPINTDVTSTLTSGVGFIPLAFVGVVLLAALADGWLYRTRTGLALRSVGLDARSSHRL